ncbi:response regulator [Allohahella marinimesophila]|uniref:Response regulator n=1 Tax=Allohahella marinimesophila TaxID=1054972 RepID=A0ABP7P0H5_9GAMM
MRRIDSSGPVSILLADDDAQDRILTEEALRLSGFPNPMHHVENGEQLMRYLRREGEYADVEQFPWPGIILLDLNMPRKDGISCLREIRRDPALSTIPIVILSTSSQAEEIERSYDLGANSYICKPADFEVLVDRIRHFAGYWFDTVNLPLGR